MPSQYHDLADVMLLIEDIDFDADRLLKELDEHGAKAVIPSKSNRKVQYIFAGVCTNGGF